MTNWTITLISHWYRSIVFPCHICLLSSLSVFLLQMDRLSWCALWVWFSHREEETNEHTGCVWNRCGTPSLHILTLPSSHKTTHTFFVFVNIKTHTVFFLINHFIIGHTFWANAHTLFILFQLPSLFNHCPSVRCLFIFKHHMVP